MLEIKVILVFNFNKNRLKLVYYPLVLTLVIVNLIMGIYLNKDPELYKTYSSSIFSGCSAFSRDCLLRIMCRCSSKKGFKYSAMN